MDSVSSLVLGTENGQVLVLDPAGSQVLRQILLPSTPIFLSTWGMCDVEYRIAAGCRDGRVYLIKNGKKLKTTLEMEAQPCGLCIQGKHIYVASMDKRVCQFTFRKQWSAKMPRDITVLSRLPAASGSGRRRARCSPRRRGASLHKSRLGIDGSERKHAVRAALRTV